MQSHITPGLLNLCLAAQLKDNAFHVAAAENSPCAAGKNANVPEGRTADKVVPMSMSSGALAALRSSSEGTYAWQQHATGVSFHVSNYIRFGGSAAGSHGNISGQLECDIKVS